ncbi:Sca4 family protein [Candidatus Tisiphia endosymbiont of Beris chalybata]|uniref:Sca4 family protein n=1 Tax=Candidatus Tisiphia endosymbiont of Beris chalybata TaxID=3066262 RepID=UPI00312CB9D4
MKEDQGVEINIIDELIEDEEVKSNPTDGAHFTTNKGKVASFSDAASPVNEQEADFPDIENQKLPLNFSLSGDEEEVDEITKAVREKILAAQRRIIAEYLGKAELNNRRDYAEFVEDEENKRKVHEAFRDPVVKAEIEKAEIEGYGYIKTHFKDDFKPIKWENRQTIIKDPETGEEIIKLKSTVINVPTQVRKLDGTEVTVRKHRKITGIPFSLDSEKISGPVVLSLDLMDQNGKYLGSSSPLRTTIHYNAQGKLIEFSSPEPMLFNGNDPSAMGYFEHEGKIITTGIDRGMYQALMQEVAKNNGHSVDISQVVEGPDIEREQAQDVVSRGLEKDTPSTATKNFQDIGNKSTSAVELADVENISKNLNAELWDKTMNPNANIQMDAEVKLSPSMDMNSQADTIWATLNKDTKTEEALIKEKLASLGPIEREQVLKDLANNRFLPAGGEVPSHSTSVTDVALKRQSLLKEQKSDVADLMGKESKSADNLIDSRIDKAKASAPQSTRFIDGKEEHEQKLQDEKNPDTTPADPHIVSVVQAENLIQTLKNPPRSPSLFPVAPTIKVMTDQQIDTEVAALWEKLQEKPITHQKDVINKHIEEAPSQGISHNYLEELLQYQKDVINKRLEEAPSQGISHNDQKKLLQKLAEKVAKGREEKLKPLAKIDEEKQREGKIPLKPQQESDDKELVTVRLKTEIRTVDPDGWPSTIVGLYDEDSKAMNTPGNVGLLAFINKSIVELKSEVALKPVPKGLGSLNKGNRSQVGGGGLAH